MQKKKKTALWLILGSLAFLVVPIIFSPHPPEEKNYWRSLPTLRDFLANGLMLAFFFINFYILIPFLYFRRKYIAYYTIVLIGFIAIGMLPSVFTGRLFSSGENPVFDRMPGNIHQAAPVFSFVHEVKHHIFLFVAVVLFSILLREKIRIKTIENEKLQAELTNLKTQIHPHFLFNTLNSIYALSLQKNDKAPQNIVKLSNFLRYLLRDSNQDQVMLDKEMDYIGDYIDLQKTRLRETVNLQYETSGNFFDYNIAPLLLFPFVENAFKYGVNPEEDSRIKINIRVENDRLIATFFNNKVNINNPESSKIGIRNTQERLLYYYPNRHMLTIKDNVGTYEVELLIELL